MNNKTALVLLLCLCVLVFAGCITEPKVLYQSESLEVIREGNITTVYDLEADEQYTFRIVRVKRGEGVSVAHTAVDTSTIKVEVLPSATLRIHDKTQEKILTISKNFRRIWG
jgi:hypothetical protein